MNRTKKLETAIENFKVAIKKLTGVTQIATTTIKDFKEAHAKIRVPRNIVRSHPDGGRKYFIWRQIQRRQYGL